MSSFDPELLQRLADADAALPPAPGVEFSPASLGDLAARRARRQLLTLMAALLLTALGLCLWPLAARADDAATAGAAELRALRADLEALRASFCEWSTTHADAERAAAEAARGRAATANLRLQLAHARAEVVLASTPQLPAKESNR